MKTMIIEGHFERYSSSTWFEGGVNLVEFIEVGGTRFNKVLWTDYMKNFMKDAVGKKVRISVGKINGALVVGAVEFDGKIEKEPKKRAFGYSFLGLLCMGSLLFCASVIVASVFSSVTLFAFVFPGSVIVWPLVAIHSRHAAVTTALDAPQVAAEAA
jgi:hypothetical protein